MEHNHRRGSKRKPLEKHLKNGYPGSKPWSYIDHIFHGAFQYDKYGDVSVGAGIGHSFSNGHRGMAKALRGAKKFVRTRIRFHINAKLKRDIKDDNF